MFKFLSINLSILFVITACATKNKSQSIKSLEGKTHHNKKVSIDFNKNKNTVLVFLSASCPCSHSHIETLKEMSTNFKNIHFVGVHSNYNERKKRATKYFDKQKINFPVIHDSNSDIAKILGAVKTPHAFIINEFGEIIYNGSVTSSSNAKLAKENWLKMALNDIRRGDSPRKAKRKTLGCYIPIKE
jgi:thioredoxin-related protein